MWIEFLTSAKFLFYFFMLLTVGLALLGDYFLEKWGLVQNKNYYLIIGAILYAVLAIIWGFTLKYEFLSKSISIFAVLNLIGAVIIGVLVFHEKLSLLNLLGILVGIASIVLVSM